MKGSSRTSAIAVCCTHLLSYGWDQGDWAGLVDRGHRLSWRAQCETERLCVASLTYKEENVLEGGRPEVVRAEKWLGGRLPRLRRLQQKVTFTGGAMGCSGRPTMNRMKKWSEMCNRVTVSVCVVQFRVRMRLKSLLALWNRGLQGALKDVHVSDDKHGTIMFWDGGEQGVYFVEKNTKLSSIQPQMGNS